jgi:hypothetical protein
MFHFERVAMDEEVDVWTEEEEEEVVADVDWSFRLLIIVKTSTKNCPHFGNIGASVASSPGKWICDLCKRKNDRERERIRR